MRITIFTVGKHGRYCYLSQLTVTMKSVEYEDIARNGLCMAWLAIGCRLKDVPGQCMGNI
jgi:hypothetical protein